MTTQHGHGTWLYACGHAAHCCKCPEHAGGKPFHRADLCPDCRAQLNLPDPPAEPVTEPFPKASD